MVGGDDRIALGLLGLSVEDQGNNTRNSVPYIICRAGDKVIPYIQKDLEKSNSPHHTAFISALRYVRTSRATAYLCDLYKNPNVTISTAAASVLVYPPYRRGAKQVYLDLLRRRVYVTSAASACAEFGWVEAVADLQTIYLEEYDAYQAMYLLRPVFDALCKLQGRPIGQLDTAGNMVVESALAREIPLLAPNPASVALCRARLSLVNSRDPEISTFVALRLAQFDTKWNRRDIKRVNEVGQDILRALPTDVSRALLSRLITRMGHDLPGGYDPYEYEKKELLGICGTRYTPRTNRLLGLAILGGSFLRSLGLPFIAFIILGVMRLKKLSEVKRTSLQIPSPQDSGTLEVWRHTVRNGELALGAACWIPAVVRLSTVSAFAFIPLETIYGSPIMHWIKIVPVLDIFASVLFFSSPLVVVEMVLSRRANSLERELGIRNQRKESASR